ncbi:baseplate wedge initiator [Synechococcus phage S-SZBM1]|uniref:Baseplate wedge initiator n=1 Tax=Synechococcus phage S-SZBM1 TaxID=2926475 RepID=A0AC61TSU5_9CAUD|nr:virion structural protein [Synechococcus phage S-SZBM1]UNH61322.1 baseplate wedge initiator [Synechococcus phage S-SZBM1]
MARTVPGSGAIIEPVFNSVNGVKDIIVIDGGSGYDPNDPPKLSVSNAGTPIRDAVLRPVIGSNGEILSVDVIDPGEGYDPLRLIIESDDEDIVKADAQIYLNPDGSVGFLQVTRPGDGYFSATARLEGGGGSGAELVPITGGVTGLAIEQSGRNYVPEDVTLVISGGGGQGATGVASVNSFGAVSEIRVTNPGEFFETPPLIQIIGGGGSGAEAEAIIELGKIKEIKLLNPGGGYTNDPQVIFTRDTNLIRAQRNRTSLTSDLYNLTGLIRDAGPADTTLYVETTNAFPGSGKFQIGNEIIRYTGKTPISFTGCSRGINFRYDQRVILDNLADTPEGISSYSFTVADRLRRVEENKSNKVAIVYDWRPESRELFLIFQVDELAFIDGGRANEKTAVIQFIAGVAGSSGTGVAPHVLIESENSRIYVFEDPISTLQGFRFEDNDELDGEGDGIADLVNIGTDFENEINLDGGIASSLYGIEETVGGQNTTLFQQGDQIYDSNLVPLVATVQSAGQLGDGIEHTATATFLLKSWNNTFFVIGEEVVGSVTGVRGTVESFDSEPQGYDDYVRLVLTNLTNNDLQYKFTSSDTFIAQDSGATAVFWRQEFTNLVRNEPE